MILEDVKIDRLLFPTKLDVLAQIAHIQFSEKRAVRTDEIKLEISVAAKYFLMKNLLDNGYLYRKKMGRYEVTNAAVVVLNYVFRKLAPIYGIELPYSWG